MSKSAYGELGARFPRHYLSLTNDLPLVNIDLSLTDDPPFSTAFWL